MSQTFGIELPRAHQPAPHRTTTRFLVVIDAAGSAVARLCLANHEPVAVFDASTEEVTLMTKGPSPQLGAADPAWDRALQGHTAAERAAAAVYTLDV